MHIGLDLSEQAACFLFRFTLTLTGFNQILLLEGEKSLNSSIELAITAVFLMIIRSFALTVFKG